MHTLQAGYWLLIIFGGAFLVGVGSMLIAAGIAAYQIGRAERARRR